MITKILSTSGKNDSIANAFNAYAGFRLESETRNKKGEGITSQDGALTKGRMEGIYPLGRGKGSTGGTRNWTHRPTALPLHECFGICLADENPIM